MKKVKNLFLFIWQLPQNLVGLIIIFLLMIAHKIKKKSLYKNIYIFEADFNNMGVSLGCFIIVDYNTVDDITIKHEYGHCIQSRYLGFFYLLIIGISSAIFCNLLDRYFHKKWTYEKRNAWYYNRFPEKWADKVGGVTRL